MRAKKIYAIFKIYSMLASEIGMTQNIAKIRFGRDSVIFARQGVSISVPFGTMRNTISILLFIIESIYDVTIEDKETIKQAYIKYAKHNKLLFTELN